VTQPRRFAGFRGKITPRSVERLENADTGGTVDPAQGSAEEARTVDERDQQASPSGGGHELASEVGERVRSIISAAEAAANAVRHEAEQEAAVRRRVAEEEARRIIEDAKADADAYLAERIRRISELSDTVVERAETIVSRLDRAEEVRQQLQSLADALGESAERLANEVRVGTPPPTVRSPSTPPGALPPPVAPPPEAPAAEAPPPPPELRDEPTGAAPAPSPEEREPAPPVDPEPLGDAPTAILEPQPTEAVVEPEAGPQAVAEAPDVVRIDRGEQPAAEAQAEADAPPTRRDADQQLGARLVALQMAVAGGNRGEVEVHLQRTFDLPDLSSILDDVFGRGTDSEKRVAWPRSGGGAA
jgi:hypothetical protein